MKKNYIVPATLMVALSQIDGILNSVSENGTIRMDASNMVGGDGSDAVKRNDYNVWNDDWSN